MASSVLSPFPKNKRTLKEALPGGPVGVGGISPVSRDFVISPLLLIQEQGGGPFKTSCRRNLCPAVTIVIFLFNWSRLEKARGRDEWLWESISAAVIMAPVTWTWQSQAGTFQLLSSWAYGCLTVTGGGQHVEEDSPICTRTIRARGALGCSALFWQGAHDPHFLLQAVRSGWGPQSPVLSGTCQDMSQQVEEPLSLHGKENLCYPGH